LKTCEPLGPNGWSGLRPWTRYRHFRRRTAGFGDNCSYVTSGEINSLVARVGFRLHSRLREMCEQFLEYDGPDFRDLPPNSGADDLYMRWKGQPRRKLPAKTSGPVCGPR
jgi:hypothetical protein